MFITNISSSSDASELNSKSTLYSIKKKLPESLILSFERFLVNDRSNDSIENILTWLKNETNLRNIANEMVKGVKEDKFKDKHSSHSFYNDNCKENKCLLCNDQHRLHECSRFKALQNNERWKLTKERRPCFKCLTPGHSIKNCRSNKLCKINNCTKEHHIYCTFSMHQS